MLATKRALEELLSLLRCAQCEGPLQEPHVVGLCGHTVCRRCIGGRDACGVCGSPTTQRELGPDPQMSGVLACATKLEQLLASVTSPSSDGLQTNDGDPPASSTSCAKNVQGPASRQCLLAHAGEVCLSRALPSSTRKGAERRNRLGETPLQVAAIKGDAARVKALLSAGANPNVRDNAGWTPLQGSLAPLEVQTFGGERKKVLSMERSGMMKCKHEASSQGALEVVRLLIAAGACVNTAGPDGITPLHDAVLSNVPDVVLLLRSAGANADASANDGRTPGSLAQNELMRAALRSPAAPAAAAVQPSVAPPAERGSSSGGAGLVLLLASGLDEAQCQALAQCARLLGGSCATSFSRQGALYGSSWNKGVRPARAACNSEAVSHLVVTCDKQGNCCQRTLKVLSAMVAGTWIVNFSWVEECLQRGVRVDEAAHEAQGVRQHPNTGAPQRARLSGGGTLFSCYSVVLQGTFARGPSRDDLATLLTMGGAQLLARVPPSSKDQQTVLVVTDQPHTSTTARSSTAVLVEPSWVLDCISRFELAPLPVA